MHNPIKRIWQFNHDADLVSAGYDDFLESSFQVEEAIEPFAADAKTQAREFVNTFVLSGLLNPDDISDVDRLDKACDAVVFAIGSMTKLGLNPDQINRALNIVMDANAAKLGCEKDEFGKLTKNKDFEGPENRLQKLLDERVT